MATVRIEFETDNAAFEDWDAEIARVLERVRAILIDGAAARGMTVRDTNGNTIGRVTVDD